MKIKIISDGLARSTRIVNADTGDEIEDVVSVTWHCDTDDQVARAAIEFVNVPVEVSGETQEN